MTGVGAVLNTARVREGQSVLVVGLGGVGLSVVQGARLAGAGQVIVVDRSPDKLELARTLGATDVLEAGGELAKQVRGLTERRGADHAFDCVGLAETIRSSWASTRRGGVTTVVGIGGKDTQVSFSPLELFHFARTLQGCVYGSTDPLTDIPKVLELRRRRPARPRRARHRHRRARRHRRRVRRDGRRPRRPHASSSREGRRRAPTRPAVRRGLRPHEGAGRRGRLEHPRPRAGRRAPTRPTPAGATATSSSRAASEVVAFLRRKWEREQDYALRKALWAFSADRIAVRFQYEWHDADGQWWRSYGNENWEFDAEGYMRRREASIDDVAIDESDRRIFGPRDGDEGELPLRYR